MRNFGTVRLRISDFVAFQQIIHVPLHGRNRIRHLLIGFNASLLQAQKAFVHPDGVITGHIAERLFYRELYLRIQRVKRNLFALGFFFGFFGDVLARHHLFGDAAQIRRELGIAAVQFACDILVFFRHLRFRIAVAPVLGIELFEGIRLLHADASERLDFALQVAHFDLQQGILDSRFVLNIFFVAGPGPCKCGRREKQNNR